LGDHLNSATHAFIHVVSNGFFITVWKIVINSWIIKTY
jgi:hypothetical protein